jgi:hypothetical protein
MHRDEQGRRFRDEDSYRGNEGRGRFDDRDDNYRSRGYERGYEMSGQRDYGQRDYDRYEQDRYGRNSDSWNRSTMQGSFGDDPYRGQQERWSPSSEGRFSGFYGDRGYGNDYNRRYESSGYGMNQFGGQGARDWYGSGESYGRDSRSGQYGQGQYGRGQYGQSHYGSGYSPTSNDYSQGQYGQGQGQYGQGQYGQGQGQYGQGQGQYGQGQGQYGQGQYGQGQYGQGQYGQGQYGGQYGQGQYGQGHYGSGQYGSQYGQGQYGQGFGVAPGGYTPSNNNSNYGSSYGGSYGPSYGSYGQGRSGSFGSGYGSQGRNRQLRGPKGYKRSDERIREDICDRLSMQDIDSSEIEVTVSNGEVTLAGTVSDRSMKWEAEQVCDAVQGVNEINNQIRVKRMQESASGTTGSSYGSTSNDGENSTRSTSRSATGRS